ncbi:MAG: hypothetical protein HYR51_13100 [Candidatus Rokubacteria bacterium]|nr:hypothetical protein [Candidatus Rokubacteria bacterium]
MSLRRYYHRHVRHHHRFNIAVLLTIIAVAWIAVPAVARFVETMSSYDPAVYEPKDGERGEWMAKHAPLSLDTLTWQTLLKVVLFVFAALAWFTVSSSATRPGGSARPAGSGTAPGRAPRR